MGAQTDERLAQYKKRYKDWEDPNGEALLLPLASVLVSKVNTVYCSDTCEYACKLLECYMCTPAHT